MRPTYDIYRERAKCFCVGAFRGFYLQLPEIRRVRPPTGKRLLRSGGVAGEVDFFNLGLPPVLEAKGQDTSIAHADIRFQRLVDQVVFAGIVVSQGSQEVADPLP